MEMDYINTSHPNFIGGTKAHEMALQQVKSSRIAAPNPRQKDGVDLEKAPTSEKSLKSRAILARSVGGLVPDQVGLFCLIISEFSFFIVSPINIAQLSNLSS
ncbi:hypothetical protein P3S67_015411 [Capsicum chacoense]